MHNLVIAPLEEGGVDGHKGRHAFTGQASSKGHGMLLGNAHVKGAAVEALLEAVHAGAPSHGCMDTNDPAVPLCLSYQGVSEEIGVGGDLHSNRALREPLCDVVTGRVTWTAVSDTAVACCSCASTVSKQVEAQHPPVGTTGKDWCSGQCHKCHRLTCNQRACLLLVIWQSRHFGSSLICFHSHDNAISCNP